MMEADSAVVPGVDQVAVPEEAPEADRAAVREADLGVAPVEAAPGAVVSAQAEVAPGAAVLAPAGAVVLAQAAAAGVQPEEVAAEVAVTGGLFALLYLARKVQLEEQE